MQSLSKSHLHPPGHGPVADIFIHSESFLLGIPSNTACDIVLIFPTPAASMYGVEIDVFHGALLVLLYHGLLSYIRILHYHI